MTGRTRLSSTWNRQDRIEITALLGVIAVMHVTGLATLILVIAPQHHHAGRQIFGVGLGVTAYLFGLRHAFDADHIAAIDNTTRKLLTDGDAAGGGTGKPKSVGFWFAMGHATIVLVQAVLVVIGAHAVGALVNGDSPARHALSFAGTLASGLFLYLIAAMNVSALNGIWRTFSALRQGSYSDEKLEAALNDRGFFARLLRPITNRVRRPIQVYPVRVLFRLGFDTATEVALLALAGTGAGRRYTVVRDSGAATAVRGRDDSDGHSGRPAHDGRLRLGFRAAGAQDLLQLHHHRAVDRGGTADRFG